MKTSKLLKRTLIVLGILVAFYAAARISGGFRVFKMPTMGNSPGIDYNDYIYVSNWISYKRFDFVCYDADDPYFGESTFAHRLCGIPGDTIEIKNGDLFVNGKNADKMLNVKHTYMIPWYSAYKVRKIEGVEFLGKPYGGLDSVHVSMASRILEPWMDAKQVIDKDQLTVNRKFPSEWTMDNFGPIILAEGEIFLLGDNRNASLDSRSNGLTNEKDIIGVVLNKK